jgi:hypothetical protein
VAVALLAGACAVSASGLLVAVAALALLAALAVLAADLSATGRRATGRRATGGRGTGRGADRRRADRRGQRGGGRGFPVLLLGVALAVTAALWVVGAARVAPVGGGGSCLGPSAADRLELPLALVAQLAAAVSVLCAANAARGGASWWRYVRHSPRLGAALAVVLHVIALGATAAVLTAVASCHAAQARFIDAVAVGAVAAGIGAVAVVLAVRLAGMVAASPASAADANGVQLALVAADVRSVAQLRVVQIAHDEVLVTARVGLAADVDVAVALGRARRHIQDFVPAARHVYLQPEPPPP